MVDLKEAEARWAKLQEAASIKRADARKARAIATGKYAACAAGNGTGPLLEELETCDQLEREADTAQKLADDVIREVFGE